MGLPVRESPKYVRPADAGHIKKVPPWGGTFFVVLQMLGMEGVHPFAGTGQGAAVAGAGVDVLGELAEAPGVHALDIILGRHRVFDGAVEASRKVTWLGHTVVPPSLYAA